MTNINTAPALKPMNCILYLRVSTDDQVKNFSLQTQEEICTTAAQRMDYMIVKTFREEGESAKTADRPELIKLLDYCFQNKKTINSVLVYRFDRVARNTLDHLAIKAKLAEHAIKLESATEPTDDTPTSKFMETVIAAVAELDNSIRAERAKNGLHKRFQAGLSTRTPLGYTNSNVNGKRVQTPDANFPLVKMAWELMATGTKSLSEMAKIMNEWGLRVCYRKHIKLITKQYISKLFKNKFYIGYLTSKVYQEEVRGQYAPMISEETFYQVQAIISGNNQVPIGVKHKVVNALFPLRGVLKCTICGHSLVSGNVKGRNKLYPKYWCANNCIRSGSADTIEEMLKDKLTSIQPNQDLVNAFTLYLQVKYESRLSKLLERKKEAEKKIFEQKQMMILLVEGHMKALYPDDVFKQEKSKIENKILAFQIIANDELSNKYDIERTINFIKALFKDLPKAYEVSDYGQKRVLLGSIYPLGLTFNGSDLLNRKIGTGFRAIQEFNNHHIALSAKRFTQIESILSSLQPLILAYPNYQSQFNYT